MLTFQTFALKCAVIIPSDTGCHSIKLFLRFYFVIFLLHFYKEMPPCAKCETLFLQKKLMTPTMKWVVIGMNCNLVCNFLPTSYINQWSLWTMYLTTTERKKNCLQKQEKNTSRSGLQDVTFPSKNRQLRKTSCEYYPMEI